MGLYKDCGVPSYFLHGADEGSHQAYPPLSSPFRRKIMEYALCLMRVIHVMYYLVQRIQSVPIS